MSEWNKYYLLPNSYFFKFNELLHKYLKMTLMFVFLSIITYFLYSWIISIQDLQVSQKENRLLKTQTAQKSEHYQSIKKYNQNLQIKDRQISELNQKLQWLFSQHHLKLEQMQWQLENGKRVHFVVVQKFQAIFKFIETLNKTAQIEFQEINLMKHDENSLLKLDLIILIQGE